MEMSYRAFDARAREYDAWYDSEEGSALLALEVDCLRSLPPGKRRPYLEIGVGSGRFAQALGVEYGVDPAPAPLRIAQTREVQVVQATGEALPLASEAFGGVLIALTLCFVSDPLNVLSEAYRVLRPGGGLVLGMMLKGGPWAEHYIQRGREGHPLYSQAHFFSKDEVQGLLQVTGFVVVQYRSTLFQMPGQSQYHHEKSVAGYRKAAGFVAIGCHKPGN